MTTMLIGTTNAGKAGEVRRHLNDLHVQWVTLADVAPDFDVEEDGKTFEANAEKKAIAASHQTGLPTIGSDSGLEIPALDGWPGLKSRRVKPDGSAATDEEIIAIAQEKIAALPADQRTFRFVSVFSFALPDGSVTTSRGELHGELVVDAHPATPHGLPYRAFWWMPQFQKYFIDLTAEEQDSINHNKIALDALRPAIAAYMATESTREEPHA